MSSEVVTKEDLKSAIEEIYPNYVSAYDVYDENADDLEYVLDNYIYRRIYDTSTGIGSCYIASSSDIISTAGINAHTSGASITVPKGTYIITAAWAFYTASSTGTTNREIVIKSGDTIVARQRYFGAAYNYSGMNCWTIEEVSATTTFTVCGSCSKTTTKADTNWIKAVKVEGDD